MPVISPHGTVYSVRTRRFARRGLRSLGTVISATPKTKHREVHSPEGVNGTSLDDQVNFCRGSLPRRGDFNLFMGIKSKKGSASVLASGPSTIA